MIREEEVYKSISKNLFFLKSLVTHNNSNNLTDINIFAEKFYGDLLNLIFNYSLNLSSFNATAIDLEDHHNKIAIQVTSDSNLAKTNHTLEKFISSGKYKIFNRLIIFNITEKAKHRSINQENAKICNFDQKYDIWDVKYILDKIKELDPEKQEEIARFLRKSLTSFTSNNSEDIPPAQIKKSILNIAYIYQKVSQKYISKINFFYQFIGLIFALSTIFLLYQYMEGATHYKLGDKPANYFLLSFLCIGITFICWFYNSYLTSFLGNKTKSILHYEIKLNNLARIDFIARLDLVKKGEIKLNSNAFYFKDSRDDLAIIAFKELTCPHPACEAKANFYTSPLCKNLILKCNHDSENPLHQIIIERSDYYVNF